MIIERSTMQGYYPRALAAKTNSASFAALIGGAEEKSRAASTERDKLIASYSLTKDQISDLKTRYDVEKLSSKELKSLLGELTDLGAITKDDGKMLSGGARPIVTGAFSRGTRPADTNFEAGNILDWLSKGVSEYTDLLDWMGAKENSGYLGSEYSLEKASNVSNVTSFKNRMERLSDVLSQLK